MWYDARAPGPDRSIVSVGLATSADGRTWTKHPNNPVIPPEARWPSVLALPQAEGGGYCVWFGAGRPRPSRSSISPKAWISLFSLAGPKQFSRQTSTCFTSKRG